jgi:hypothetical protein
VIPGIRMWYGGGGAAGNRRSSRGGGGGPKGIDPLLLQPTHLHGAASLEDAMRDALHMMDVLPPDQRKVVRLVRHVQLQAPTLVACLGAKKGLNLCCPDPRPCRTLCAFFLLTAKLVPSPFSIYLKLSPLQMGSPMICRPYRTALRTRSVAR